MANTVRVKRRMTGGAGAPVALKTAEIAYSGVDDVLYIGFGDDGGGNATSIKTLAGFGAFLALVGNQTINGIKTFTASPLFPTATQGDNTTKAATTAFVTAAVAALGGVPDGDKGDITVVGGLWNIDPNVVTLAKLATIATATFLGRASAGSGNVESLTAAQMKTLLALDLVSNTADVSKPISTAQQAALDSKAPLSNAALAGIPTAPTASLATNSTQLATTQFVQSAVAALINAAPGTLDTLAEIATAFGNDPNFAATMTVNLASKMAKASNLSDLVDVAIARTNLGLGSMAIQNSNSVNITGGVIDGITVDGGTY